MRQNLKLFLEIMATLSFVLKRNANILIMFQMHYWGILLLGAALFKNNEISVLRCNFLAAIIALFWIFYVLHQTLIREQWMFICHLSADHLLSWMTPSTRCSPQSKVTDFISFWNARTFCNSHEWMLHTVQLRSPCCDENYWKWCTIPCLCSI